MASYSLLVSYQLFDCCQHLRTRFLEAMLSSCPVIATEGGEIADIVTRYNAGTVVPASNVPALRSAIKDLMIRPKSERVSIRNPEKLLQDYAWDRVIRPLVQFCNNPRRSIDCSDAPDLVSVNHCATVPPSLPDFSILLTTFDRMDILPEVVSAIEKQSGVQDFELIIVVDGSTDGTAEWLQQQEFIIPVTIVHQENSGPARARNRAVTKALGQYIAFLGDDMVPDRHWLSSHVDAHTLRQRDPNLIIVGKTEWHNAIKRTPFLDHIDQTGWQFAFDAIEDPENLPFNYFYGSNVSMSRHWLESQPYNTDFPYPAWEDSELGY